MELGDTYVKNAQLQGQTNFLNQYGHGNTQVDNLAGLAGSVQNFGLQELLIGPEWTWNPNVAKPTDLQELLIGPEWTWNPNVAKPALQNLMIGPMWTFDSSVPKPAGTKDMGGW